MKTAQSEEGYTLVESLVAMMLFGGALIPLLGIMSNLMFDQRNTDKYRAFLLAQSEMNRIIAEQDLDGPHVTLEDGFRIERKITAEGRLFQISVIIESVRRPDVTLIQLNRAVLASAKIE